MTNPSKNFITFNLSIRQYGMLALPLECPSPSNCFSNADYTHKALVADRNKKHTKYKSVFSIPNKQ